MSKTNEKGPKKVDQNQYKDLMKEQAEKHANFIANVNPSDSPQTKDMSAWRKGDQQYSQQQYQQQEAYVNQDLYSIEEKKISKHAKRRANKKKKIVVEGGGEDN